MEEVIELYWYKTHRDDGIWFCCETDSHPDIRQVFNHGNVRYIVGVNSEQSEFYTLPDAVRFSNKFIREDWKWRLYGSSRKSNKHSRVA